MALVCAILSAHVARRVVGNSSMHAMALIYTITIGTYVLSRFVLAACYRQPRDVGLEPRVAIIIPAFNEGPAVARTVDACATVDYPASKVEIVCVDDGSSDETFQIMERAAARYGGRVTCVKFPENRGKRAAMAEGLRRSTAPIVLFVDSDSEPAPDALRKLVQGFAKPDVGGVAGLTNARNADVNALTRMQAARYFVSYQLLKSAESVVSAVACCSGCFSAYRREAVEPVIDEWEHQHFLGVACTYGDDRALTNLIIKRGYRTIYHAGAVASTDVPTEYRRFFRQQLRWKKSWLREGPLLMSHAWRTRPLAFPSILIATLAGVMSPVVLITNVIARPALDSIWPVTYALGLFLVAMGYGLFHRATAGEEQRGQWLWAVIGTVFYLAFSLQMVWAALRVRDGRWGTRAA